jgi:hypothetical protein
MRWEDYQLRYAAGRYWLLDMRQRGSEYHRPLCFNESGAYLWELFAKGMTKEQIAAQLCEEFELEEGQALQDVEEFLTAIEKLDERL